MKRVLKPGGRLVLTTRSVGFQYHEPPDYWRFSMEDMREIFADMERVLIEPDSLVSGVFGVGTRGDYPDYPRDLSWLSVYPMPAVS